MLGINTIFAKNYIVSYSLNHCQHVSISLLGLYLFFTHRRLISTNEIPFSPLSSEA